MQSELTAGKLQIERRHIDTLIPYARNSRTHSPKQIEQLVASIREFGFINPVLIAADNQIIAGHGRVMAAKQAGITEVPCICAAHLSEKQVRAYVIADNKLATNSEWDENMLLAELEHLEIEGFDLGAIGFSDDELGIEAPDAAAPPRENAVREVPVSTVSASFWISVRGPLQHQAAALLRLQELMRELPVNVELGTTANELG